MAFVFAVGYTVYGLPYTGAPITKHKRSKTKQMIRVIDVQMNRRANLADGFLELQHALNAVESEMSSSFELVGTAQYDISHGEGYIPEVHLVVVVRTPSKGMSVETSRTGEIAENHEKCLAN